MIPIDKIIAEANYHEEQVLTDKLIDEIDKILKLKKYLAENETPNLYT